MVNTDKILRQNKNMAFNFRNKITIPAPFPLWRHYPRYHIIPPPSPGQILAINTWANAAKAVTFPLRSTTTSTTTTTTPKPTTSSTTAFPPLLRDDEFPAELLDIAQNKLGLKSLDEIPSISELGQLSGTTSPEETLKYIKQLTSNEQGVALVKAYIESADYTDNTMELANKSEFLENEEENDELGDIEEPLQVNDEGLIVVTDEDSNDDYEISNEEQPTRYNIPNSNLTTTNSPEIFELPKNNHSFIERLRNYTHINNLFNKEEKIIQNEELNQLNRLTENGKKLSNKKRDQMKKIEENQTTPNFIKDYKEKNNSLKNPILLREEVPYNYPIPIRKQKTSITTSTLTPVSDTSVIHLNTPKIILPHVQQISRVTKIPTKQIEDFLARKPKLLELATKISRFPFGHERNSPIEAQVMAAVQKAFEQDDDLKKLLSSKATLK